MTAERAESKPPGPATPTTPPNKPHPNTDKQERQRVSALIGRHVMTTLGRPPDLHAVQVRRLWEDYYRVNIFVGVDAASAKIANSYFLVADGDGNIVTSTPDIIKQYPPLGEGPPLLGGPATAPARL